MRTNDSNLSPRTPIISVVTMLRFFCEKASAAAFRSKSEPATAAIIAGFFDNLHNHHHYI